MVEGAQGLAAKLVGISRVVDQHVNTDAAQTIAQGHDTGAVHHIERLEPHVRMTCSQFAETRRLGRLTRRGDDRPACCRVLPHEFQTDAATRTGHEHGTGHRSRTRGGCRACHARQRGAQPHRQNDSHQRDATSHARPPRERNCEGKARPGLSTQPRTRAATSRCVTPEYSGITGRSRSSRRSTAR